MTCDLVFILAQSIVWIQIEKDYLKFLQKKTTKFHIKIKAYDLNAIEIIQHSI